MTDYLQWTEKYRPCVLKDIIGQQNNINIIKSLLSNNSLPHLLFYGNPGTGKTTTIISLINHVYGNNVKLMVMKLDASDDRKINTVRDEIKIFAESSHMFIKGTHVVILDEVDLMTLDAQIALKSIIEKYTATVRFCLICNHENKLLNSIKTKCLNLKFKKLENNFVYDKIQYIAENENCKCNETVLNIITDISKGDLRKAINMLQTVSLLYNINYNIIYNICCYPNNKSSNIIFSIIINKQISLHESLLLIKKIIIDENILFTNLLNKIFIILINNKCKYDKLCDIIIDLSDLENKIINTNILNLYICELIGIIRYKI